MASAAEVLLLVRAKDDASKVLSGISKNATAMGNTLKSAGKVAAIGLAGGIGIAAVGIKAFVGEAEEARKVMAQTEAVIKSTGGAAGLTSREISKMAQDYSNATNFTDDAVQSAQNVLLTFTKVGKEAFKPATGAILDMATALKTDLQSATILVGKALNDPIKGITALTRSGVQFTESQKEQIKVAVEAGDTFKAQTIILKELETQFGGSAAAAADPMTQLSNAFSELKEQLGTLFLPVIGAAATLLKDKLVPAIQDGVAAVGNFATTIKAGLAGDVTAAAEAFNLLPAPLQALALWLNDHRPQIETLIQNVKALIPVVQGLANDALQGWVDIFATLGPPLAEFGRWIIDHRPVLIALSIALAAVLAVLIGWPLAIVLIIAAVGILVTKLGEWRKSNEDLDATLKAVEVSAGLFRDTVKEATGFVEEHRTAQVALTEAAKQLSGPIYDTVQSIRAVITVFEIGTKAAYWMKDAFYSVRDAAYAVRDAINSIPNPLGSAGKLFGKVPGFASGVQNFAGGLAVVGERGPELMYVPRGANVYSNSDSRQMAAAAGPTHQTFYIDRLEIHGDPSAGLSALGASV